jgi:hypothetical protein
LISEIKESHADNSLEIEYPSLLDERRRPPFLMIKAYKA